MTTSKNLHRAYPAEEVALTASVPRTADDMLHRVSR
jgi:hypothetical protein